MDSDFIKKFADPHSDWGRQTHWKLTQAFEHCSDLYKSVRKKYDGLPYSHHIRMVAVTAIRHFKYQTFEERISILIACFGHDLIEDARVSYGDLKTKYGVFIANIIFAVTDYTGKTRAERACYDKTRAQEFATYVKMCDRYANGSYSKLTGSRMYETYKQEYPKFREALHSEDPYNVSLWNELDLLFSYVEDNVLLSS